VLDLTHVDDVVEGFLVASRYLLTAREPVWDIGFPSGERVTLKNVAALLARAFGGEGPVRLGSRPYRAKEIMTPIIAPASAALAEWKPVRRLEDSLPALIASRR
jgi:nucleoside-diphosphate-sugar epimerase